LSCSQFIKNTVEIPANDDLEESREDFTTKSESRRIVIGVFQSNKVVMEWNKKIGKFKPKWFGPYFYLLSGSVMNAIF
jgi:hypothetical protein